MSELNYWRETHSPLYSFIFTLPLFLIYEIGVFAISASDLPLLRNGADVLMRQILEIFGVFGVYGFSGTFLIGFIVAFLRQKKNIMKVIFDYFFATVGLFLLLPLLIIIGVCIKATSKGPIFYTQQRVGRYGNT